MAALLAMTVNFLRQNRWPILLLIAWLFVSFGLFGGFGSEPVSADDVLFFMRQQALYIVIFAIFLSTMAVHDDRRSRRILLVLSKAIGRSQYLAAIAASAGTVALASSLVLAITSAILLQKAGLAAAANGWIFALATFLLAALGDCIALLFATFLNPFVASAIAGAILAAPFLATSQSYGSMLLPGSSLVRAVVQYNLQPSWNAAAFLTAFVWSLLFFGLAVLVFDRVDVGVSAE